MKKILWIFSVIVFCACNQNKSKVEPEISDCSCKDLITVYGNIHLVNGELSSGEGQDYMQVMEVQSWLYNNISEHIVLEEGIPFTGRVYTYDSLVKSSGLKSSSLSNLEIEQSLDYVGLYDVTVRFIAERKKEVYGMENDSLFNLQHSLLLKSKDSLKFPEEFYKLNDARSKKYAENALKICAKKCEPIAIVVGEMHLEWFKENGYKIIYPLIN